MKIRRVKPSPILQKKLRVAAYARVSVDTLHHSLAAQVSYYSALIQKNPAWEYAGVYADEGISGTNTKKRDGFNQMLEDAPAGKSILIITKSVSRFAWNTVDSLQDVRKLDNVGMTEEHGRVEQELGVLAERLEMLIRENARVAQDQTEYLKQENEIRALYIEKQGNLEKLGKQIAEREGKRKTLESMIQVVCGIDGEQVAFDEELRSGLLDHIVVKEDGAVVVVFKGGIEIGVDG